MRLPKIFSTREVVDKVVMCVLSKPIYNRNANTFLSPFKKALIKMFLSQKNLVNLLLLQVMSER